MRFHRRATHLLCSGALASIGCTQAEAPKADRTPVEAPAKAEAPAAPAPPKTPASAAAAPAAPAALAKVQLSPATAYAFGDVRPGEPAQGWISVASLGPGAIRFKSARLEPASSDVWEISPAFEGALEADDRSGLVILYLPCAGGEDCPPRTDSAMLHLEFEGAQPVPPIKLSARVVAADERPPK